jgi:hypothetical protein
MWLRDSDVDPARWFEFLEPPYNDLPVLVPGHVLLPPFPLWGTCRTSPKIDQTQGMWIYFLKRKTMTDFCAHVENISTRALFDGILECITRLFMP